MMYQELLTRVKELRLPMGMYAIFGSGPLGVRGIREPHDIDIIVTKELYNEYRERPDWRAKRSNGDEYLDNGGVELWRNWRPGKWDIEQLIRDAEIIDGLPYVCLEDVLKWKRINNRPKDQEDIKKNRKLFI